MFLIKFKQFPYRAIVSLVGFFEIYPKSHITDTCTNVQEWIMTTPQKTANSSLAYLCLMIQKTSKQCHQFEDSWVFWEKTFAALHQKPAIEHRNGTTYNCMSLSTCGIAHDGTIIKDRAVWVFHYFVENNFIGSVWMVVLHNISFNRYI